MTCACGQAHKAGVSARDIRVHKKGQQIVLDMTEPGQRHGAREIQSVADY